MSVFHDERFQSCCCCDDVLERDFECTCKFIEDDAYNNSAWTARTTAIKDFLAHQEEILKNETKTKKKKKTFSSLSDSSSSSSPGTASLAPGKDAKQPEEERKEEKEKEKDWSSGGADEGEKVEERRSTATKLWRREVK